MREIRMSPDGDSVAIRSNATGNLAWGVLSMEQTGARVKGSRWAGEDEVADWITMLLPESL